MSARLEILRTLRDDLRAAEDRALEAARVPMTVVGHPLGYEANSRISRLYREIVQVIRQSIAEVNVRIADAEAQDRAGDAA